MTDPDKEKRTEIDLEKDQQMRLLDLFHRIKTYDARESVIGFCSVLISDENES